MNEAHPVNIAFGLNGRPILTTNDVEHRKVRHGGHTYYIARRPEGDLCIHKTLDGSGYGGRVISFLMEDGTFEEVKGPFNMDGFQSNCEGAIKAAGFEVTWPAYRLVVGRNLSSLHQVTGKAREVVFEEVGFTCGDWRDRVREEWSGLQLAIVGRHITSHRIVDEVLKERGMESEVSPWKFACKWYQPDQIATHIANRKRFGSDHPHIPANVDSREFAEWLTHEYRLAMNKGIEIGRDALDRRERILSRGIQAVLALIDESQGVGGLHLNGDFSPWSELRAGGRFEEWLADFDKAVELLGKREQPVSSPRST